MGGHNAKDGEDQKLEKGFATLATLRYVRESTCVVLRYIPMLLFYTLLEMVMVVLTMLQSWCQGVG